jgi:hypothetical protein
MQAASVVLHHVPLAVCHLGPFLPLPRYGAYPGYGPYGPYQRDPYTTSKKGRSIYYVLPEAFGESAAPRMPGRLPPGYRGGRPGQGQGGLPGLGASPIQGLIQVATNLLLQLPFSR